MLFGAVDHSSAKDHSQQPIRVCFEQMNRFKFVELVVTRFLFNHNGDNGFPSFNRASVGVGDIQKSDMGVNDMVGSC
jgi:hypothetical protein